VRGTVPVIPRVTEIGRHAVQFYDDEIFLATAVSEFLTHGLKEARPCVAVATPRHAAAIQGELARGGARSADRVTFLDAGALLNGFLVNAEPDAGGLRATIGKVIGELVSRP